MSTVEPIGWLFRVKGEANPWNYTRELFANEAYEFMPVVAMSELDSRQAAWEETRTANANLRNENGKLRASLVPTAEPGVTDTMVEAAMSVPPIPHRGPNVFEPKRMRAALKAALSIRNSEKEK